ncbi:MAG: NAD(P)-dependent oxidoreductase [Candidatus Moranbacteria bacterium]|jgi:nucleoside-diphosphate-sugar epimerase|nr:NAD(P)-dependent oxidoreductase [Candidatus Moranbacteria bacterium]
MKIFITGSSGFIGKELIQHLSSKHEIVEFAHDADCDILNYDQLKSAMKGCDVVVHLAAHRKPYEDKVFQDYFETNCQGTFNVAQACMENGVKKLIFTSSMSYYGMEKGMPIKVPVIEDSTVLTQRVKTEDLPQTVRDCDIAYSTSKVIGEQVLANYGMTKKFEVIILRLGPTRPKGVYKPFGELKLHVKIENALQAIENAINSDKKLWYEAFSIVDEIEGVDISKAKKILNYKPI